MSPKIKRFNIQLLLEWDPEQVAPEEYLCYLLFHIATARKPNIVFNSVIIYCHYLTAPAFEIQDSTGLRRFHPWLGNQWLCDLGHIQVRRLNREQGCGTVYIQLNLYNGMIAIRSKKTLRLHSSRLYGRINAWGFKAKDFIASSYLCCWVCISLTHTTIHIRKHASIQWPFLQLLQEVWVIYFCHVLQIVIFCALRGYNQQTKRYLATAFS